MSTIVGLFTDILAPGGVQRAGRHIAAVTAAFAISRGLTTRFLSLNDPQGLHTMRVGATEFSVSGHAHDKLQFALAAMRASGRKPALVIAGHPHLAPIIWAMHARSRKFRSIVFAHGIEVWQPLGWPRGAALRRANMVTGPSEDTVRQLISQQGIRPEKTRRLAWGLDPEFESRVVANVPVSLPAGFPHGGKIVLTVGRWDPAEQYKGADTLIEALPKVLRSAPDIFLVLVGDGKDRPRLEQIARNCGVSDHTRFLHGLTQDELFACYASCDAFALPSRGEGFGLVFLEAMALGKPVIGGAHGGIPDVVEDGVTGLLIPYGDIGGLSDAIESLLADPLRAKKMGAMGRDLITGIFSFQQFQMRLTQLFEDVLPGEP